jgi:polyisoprenoid-binding protein YceI
MKLALSLALLAAAPLALPAAAPSLVPVAHAAAGDQVFAIDGDPKFVNIAFESRMEVEDILGTSRQARGSFSLAAKGGGAFDLAVPVASLRTGIDKRDEHLRSATWLDAARFPDLTFKGSGIVHQGGDAYEATGTFTMHGVAKARTIAVEGRRIPAETAAKLGLPAGEWMRLRASFTVKLSEHGIAIPSTTVAKVADEWTVRLSLFAKAGA